MFGSRGTGARIYGSEAIGMSAIGGVVAIDTGLARMMVGCMTA
jgi:hypothetical protein